MKVFLVHHAEVLAPEVDPQRRLSPTGREQADRLGARFRALGVTPTRILHSDKQWTIETAQRVAVALGAPDNAVRANYPINTGDPIGPFIDEITTAQGDLMMCGHVDYLLRTASQLVCGRESQRIVEFKPGNGTAVWLEGSGNDWVVTAMWRMDHPAG